MPKFKSTDARATAGEAGRLSKQNDRDESDRDESYFHDFVQVDVASIHGDHITVQNADATRLLQ